MSDCVGLKLGNYRIIRLLGQGGFASVYLGEHVYLNTPAAIKVLNMQLAHHALESFLKEARTIARLEHTHIIRVLEFGIEEITPFLVMSYAEHGTLRHRYPRTSILPWTTIASYTKQVASALQYAHDHGVIHRDIKPENMLLRENLTLQLSDFGLAIIAQSTNVPARVTAGTTAYMAPEQIQGQPGRASDQYALGVVAYEWFCGSCPFTGSEREITIQHLYTSPPPLRAKAPAVTPAIEKVVMRALAKEPGKRFASVQEFGYALEDACMMHTLQNSRLADRSAISLESPLASSIPGQEKSTPTSSEEDTALSQLPPDQIGRTSFEKRGAPAPGMDGTPDDLPLHFADGEGAFTVQSRISSLSVEVELREPYSQFPLQTQERNSPPYTPPAFSLVVPVSDPPFTPKEGVVSSQARKLPPGTPLPTLMRLPTTGVSRTRVKPHRPKARLVAIALSGLLVIGLMIFAGVISWPRFTQDKRTVFITQQATVPATTTPSVTAGGQETPPGTTATATVGQTSVIPTMQAGATPTIQPVTIPTKAPATAPIATPDLTPVPPLTVTITSAPTSAPAYTIVAISTKANEGGVIIALNGKVRSFGQKTANSQGIAVFQIRVVGKVNILTATATDQNGNEASSSPWTITVT